jgi:hypothetical protein
MPLERALDTIDMQIIKPMMKKGLLGGLYKANLAGTADQASRGARVIAMELYPGYWDFISINGRTL